MGLTMRVWDIAKALIIHCSSPEDVEQVLTVMADDSAMQDLRSMLSEFSVTKRMALPPTYTAGPAKTRDRESLAIAELEQLAPTSLNVVNFRYRGAMDDDSMLDKLNQELLQLLQTRGIASPSSTRLDGRFSIRVAITNHRSRRTDFDALIDGVLRIGEELEQRFL